MNNKEREQLYTVRWHVREKWGEPSAKQDVLRLLGQLLDPAVTPEERPSVSKPGAKLLWCPFAQTDFPKSQTRGSYAKGYPLGAIVHFTAGRRSGLKAAMQEQFENGYTYFVIDEHGNIGQNFPLDSWGYHAGQSSWPPSPAPSATTSSASRSNPPADWRNPANSTKGTRRNHLQPPVPQHRQTTVAIHARHFPIAIILTACLTFPGSRQRCLAIAINRHYFLAFINLFLAFFAISLASFNVLALETFRPPMHFSLYSTRLLTVCF